MYMKRQKTWKKQNLMTKSKVQGFQELFWSYRSSDRLVLEEGWTKRRVEQTEDPEIDPHVVYHEGAAAIQMETDGLTNKQSNWIPVRKKENTLPISYPKGEN